MPPKLGERRGISPIFAALIMLGIVTVLFIPVFLWSTGLTSGTRDFWERSGMIATERIVIEETSLRRSSTNSTVYVRNIGKTAATMGDIFIVDDYTSATYHFGSGQFTVTDPVTGNPMSSSLQGDLMKIYIANIGFTPTADRTYVIKAFTSRAVGDMVQVKA